MYVSILRNQSSNLEKIQQGRRVTQGLTRQGNDRTWVRWKINIIMVNDNTKRPLLAVIFSFGKLKVQKGGIELIWSWLKKSTKCMYKLLGVWCVPNIFTYLLSQWFIMVVNILSMTMNTMMLQIKLWWWWCDCGEWFEVMTDDSDNDYTNGDDHHHHLKPPWKNHQKTREIIS